MRRTATLEKALDLAVLGEVFEVSVEGLDEISWQIELQNISWPASAVLTVEVSNNGGAWAGVPAGAVTHSAEGIGAAVTVTAFKRARLRVSTAAGTSPQMVKVTFYGEGRDSA